MSTPSIRARIEDEVVSRLSPLKHSIGVRSIEVYNGEFDAKALDDIKRRSNGALPGIFVSTSQCSLRDISNGRGRYVKDQDIEILVMSISERSREDAVRRSGKDPGVYVICEAIHPLLIGQQSAIVGVGMYDATRGESVVLREPDRTVWKIGYQVPIDVQKAAMSAEDLLELEMTLNFPSPELDTADNPVVTQMTSVGGG